MLDISKAIEEHLNDINLMDKVMHKPENSERFFVHGVGFNCMLAKYWGIIKPKPFDLKTRKKMLRGKLYHRFIQDIIRKKFSEVIDENDSRCRVMKKYGNMEFSGRPDLIKFEGENHGIVPIEIKSFDDRWGNKYIPNVIHITQLNMYLDMFGVNHGYLCYIGMNFDDYWFRVDKNDLMIKGIVEKYDKLSECLKNEIEPERSESWECKECRYMVECELALRNKLVKGV